MFETIRALPELKGFRPDYLYRRLCSFIGENPMMEEWITDGAVDAYMECLQSGDFTDVAKKAYLNGWKRCQQEARHVAKHNALITEEEYAKGYRGVVIDKDVECYDDGPSVIRYDERGLSVPLREVLDKASDVSLDKLVQFIRRGAKELEITHKTHPDYDVADVLVAYYCDGVSLKELHGRMPSFGSYAVLSYTVKRDLGQIQAWSISDEGRVAFREIFGIDPFDLMF